VDPGKQLINSIPLEEISQRAQLWKNSGMAVTPVRMHTPLEEIKVVLDIFSKITDKKSVSIERLYWLGLVKEPYFFHVISRFLNPMASSQRRDEAGRLLLEAAKIAPERFADILEKLKNSENIKNGTGEFIQVIYENLEFFEIAEMIFKEKIMKEFSEFNSVTQADKIIFMQFFLRIQDTR